MRKLRSSKPKDLSNVTFCEPCGEVNDGSGRSRGAREAVVDRYVLAGWRVM